MICAVEDLPPALAGSASAEEKDHIARIKSRGMLPFAVTAHFASLARPERDDPIRRQFFPDPREAVPDPFGLGDPLGESLHRAAPLLVHQYRDRALLLAARACFGYCRHCFRRAWISSREPGCHDARLGSDGLREELAYLSARPEIREVLVSGGDPLTLGNASLRDLFRDLRSARPDVALRICSRAPITEPSMLDGETAALFAEFRPLRLSVHVNHPRELSEQSRAALAACAQAGIPMLAQTVLLRGVNDEPALLAALFRDCAALGLAPYYLFQLDLAPGTAHFRVPLKRALAIHCELRAALPEAILPAFAVDLPGGGGKIRLRDGAIAGERISGKGAEYVLKDKNGAEWFYPAE